MHLQCMVGVSNARRGRAGGRNQNGGAGEETGTELQAVPCRYSHEDRHGVQIRRHAALTASRDSKEPRDFLVGWLTANVAFGEQGAEFLQLDHPVLVRIVLFHQLVARGAE